MARKFGLSFSWKRALGLSGLKAKVSRHLGVPLTRSGRQRKVGRALGCLVLLTVSSAFAGALAVLLLAVSPSW